MRVAIFGSGSIGGYIGARLTLTGVDTLLVDAWQDHVLAMRRDGLRLTTAEGGDEIVAVDCAHISDLHRIGLGSIDLAILCVKSYETRWMTTLLRDYLAPGGAVLSMQNSMNEETIAEVVGHSRVLGCTLTRLGSELEGPGLIHRWMGPPDANYAVFRVGELHGMLSRRVETVVDLLSGVDKAIATRNLWGERWSKLSQNAMASGISPLTHQSINELFTSEVMLPVMVALVREAITVGQCVGYALEKICGIALDAWNDPRGLTNGSELFYGLEAWQQNMGPGGQASTLHDMRRGRRTEIEAINGLIARKAQEMGVEAPMHAVLCKRVRAQELQPAAEASYREEELAAELWAAAPHSRF